MSTNISKILKIDGSLDSLQLRFERNRVVLQGSNNDVSIGNAEIPGVIALLERARDELLDETAAKSRRSSVRSQYAAGGAVSAPTAGYLFGGAVIV